MCGAPINPNSHYCVHHRSYARGAQLAQWKGGRAKHGNYMAILLPNHPRANTKGYVSEHILVWEQFHGKPLPKGWIVHHLNGIGLDNRIANLIALPNRKHRLILSAKAKRIQELEAQLNQQNQLL